MLKTQKIKMQISLDKEPSTGDYTSGQCINRQYSPPLIHLLGLVSEPLGSLKFSPAQVPYINSMFFACNL
jgi:hypothetical protein